MASSQPVKCKKIERVQSEHKCTFKWEIENFRSTSTMSTGQICRSDKFVSAGLEDDLCTWQLWLYPMGDRKESEGYLSLFLHSCDHRDFEAEFTFHVLEGNDIKSVRGVVKNLFSDKHRTWGYDKWMKRSELLLDKDKLTILCQIHVSYKDNKVPKIAFWPDTPDYSDKLKVLDDFEKILDDNEFSDVKFIIGKQTLHAHKTIVSNRSEVFAAMFKHDMKENKENVVRINDIKYKVFVELLRYIYSCKVQNIDVIAKDLLAAADKYGIDNLKMLCEETLCKNVTVDNALEYLKFADRYNSENLKKLVKKFIVEHAKEMSVKPEFKLIAKLHADLIVEVFQSLADELPCKQ